MAENIYLSDCLRPVLWHWDYLSWHIPTLQQLVRSHHQCLLSAYVVRLLVGGFSGATRLVVAGDNILNCHLMHHNLPFANAYDIDQSGSYYNLPFCQCI